MTDRKERLKALLKRNPDAALVLAGFFFGVARAIVDACPTCRGTGNLTTVRGVRGFEVCTMCKGTGRAPDGGV